MPLVSVIIATYNRAAWLPSTIDSVLAQSFRDFELIVVDDGSTDATRQSLERFGGRLRYTYQSNAERGAARNRGLEMATGDFVAFLDSDDLWTPRKLEHEVRALSANDGLGLVYSDAVFIDERGAQTGRVERHRFHGDVLRDIARQNFVPFGAHLLRRAAFERAGGFSEDRTLSGSEDWEAWTRLAALYPFGSVGRVGLLYRIHAQGTVAMPGSMQRSMQRAIDVIYSNPTIADRIAPLRPQTEAYAALVTSSLHYAAGEPRLARTWLRQALRTYQPIVFTRQFRSVALRVLTGRRVMRELGRLKSRVQGRV